MKKRLLNEKVTRRMMKLANIPALSDSFITESAALYNRDEEEMPPADEPAVDDAPEADLAPAPPDLAEPVEDDAVSAEEEAQPTGDMDLESLMSTLASSVEGWWKEQTGEEVEMSVSSEEEDVAAADDMLDAEPELPAMDDMAPEDEMPVEEPPEAAPEDLEEAAAPVTTDVAEEGLTEDEMVNEIARRVARRLLSETE